MIRDERADCLLNGSSGDSRANCGVFAVFVDFAETDPGSPYRR
jgi:hypothetical protein